MRLGVTVGASNVCVTVASVCVCGGERGSVNGLWEMGAGFAL